MTSLTSLTSCHKVSKIHSNASNRVSLCLIWTKLWSKKSKPIKFQYFIYIGFHGYSQDFISFRTLQTRSLYDDFSWSYSQNRLSQSKFSILVKSVSMVTLYLILFFTKILDFISFHRLQTRVSIIIFHEIIAKTV